MIKKLRSRRGVTLTELMVSLALVAILTVGVSSGITAAAVAQRDSVAFSEASLLLDSVTKALIGELRFATDVSVSDALGHPRPPEGYRYDDTTSFASSALYLSTVYGLNTRFYTAVENGGGRSRIFVEAEGASYPLLGEGTYTDLGAKLVELKYDAATRGFLVELAIELPSGSVQSYPPFWIYPVFQAVRERSEVT